MISRRTFTQTGAASANGAIFGPRILFGETEQPTHPATPSPAQVTWQDCEIGLLYSFDLAIADKLEGPYLHQPDKLSANDQRVEDGYAFITGDKVCLMTTDNSGKFGHGGGLLWTSEDGIHFIDLPERGYRPPSHYLPKVDRSRSRSYYGAGTFQRPQVLLKDGRPAYLYVASGSVLNGGDGTVCYVLRCAPVASP